MTSTTLSSFGLFGRQPKRIAKPIVSKHAVIYTRVSSKEQADKNLSLDTQRKTIEEYAHKQNMPIAAYFGGTYESAKTDGKKEFIRMLEFIKRNKATVSHVLVYPLDRFSRTGGAAIKVATDLREKYGVVVFAVTQPTDTSNPSGVLHQNIQLLFSEFDNQLRRQRAIAGLKEQYQKGIWANKPPQGYDTVVVNGHRKLVINEEGKKLRKAFIWKAQGLTNEEIISRLNAMGLPMYKQQLTKIFKRTFYCGVINHGLLNGEVVQGVHEPLVSKELFLQVNEIHQQAAGYGVAHKKEDDHIPLKVFIKCADCGEPMTGYLVKAKGLYYYKCRKKGCCNNWNAVKMHQLFDKLLSFFVVQEKYESSIIYDLECCYEESTRDQREQEVILKRQLEEVEKDIATLKRNFFMKETMDRKTFEEMYLPCEEQKASIVRQLGKYGETISNPSELIAKVVHFCRKLNTAWASGPVEFKQDLQKLIFPRGILYDKKKGVFRTQEINSVFLCIARLKGGLEGNEKGTDQLFDGLSLAADRTGLEPATSAVTGRHSNQLNYRSSSLFASYVV